MKHLPRRVLVAPLLAALFLAGCESVEPPSVVVLPDQRLVPAMRLSDDSQDTMPRIVELKVPVAGPQLRPIDAAAPAGTTTGPAAIGAAKSGATTQPSADGFLNAIQYYDYAPGLVYTAITSPGYVTTIALSPGEKLLTAAAGDTTRWIVQSVDSGSGASAQTLLLVKPRKAGLLTNLVDMSAIALPAFHVTTTRKLAIGRARPVRGHRALPRVLQAGVQRRCIGSGPCS